MWNEGGLGWGGYSGVNKKLLNWGWKDTLAEFTDEL